MFAVRMMEVTFHKVVRMITVRNGLVSTVGPVFVPFFVSSAIMVRGARCWVLPAHGDLVLVNMTRMRGVEMSIMKIVLVPFVSDGRMTAIRTVHVRVSFVSFMIAHFSSP